MTRLISLLTILAATAGLASAQTSEANSFMSGLLHPVLGFDHLVAMVAVGLLSVQMTKPGNRSAVWIVPATFVAVLMVGGLIGLGGITLPFDKEIIIALSVMLLGGAIVSQARLPLIIGMIAVSIFALYHGYAHGQEFKYNSEFGFFAGFMIASAVMHLIGVVIGELGRIFPNPGHARAIMGAVMMGVGVHITLIKLNLV